MCVDSSTGGGARQDDAEDMGTTVRSPYVVTVSLRAGDGKPPVVSPSHCVSHCVSLPLCLPLRRRGHGSVRACVRAACESIAQLMYPKCLISLCTNPVSILSVPIQTST
jgi:hypothetical protein